ncbi:hypothetical protein PRJ_2120 [Pseudomonas sp. XWY-1]|uniref:P22 phage major capsid protein family protein n=1 Tax=Pseudomonas sp. XWY-1 TaxID=2069256 RepID=UPI000CDCACE2|nr:P22 phage major capsid protein family protein [Pseudomonas sp. XWY-1]AUZ58723.1 hypothetical protein PRJ_2120 [Pseudomonas sp. XWY-1]
MTQSLVVFRAFGNDLSKIQTETFLPQILARMDERTPLVRLITINTADESKRKGEVLTVKKPQYIEGVRHQTAEPSIADDINADTVKLELTEHIYLETQVSDRELAGTIPGFLPDSILAMADAMGRDVNQKVMNLQKQVARASGIVDSVNERSKYDMIVGRQTCNKMKIWDNKNLVLSNDTSGELIKVFTAGSDAKSETEGNLGRKYGFDTYEDNVVGIHEAGTASQDLSLKVSVDSAVGSTLLIVNGATPGATFNEGDFLTIAGVSQTFAVKASVDADGAGNASIYVTEPVTRLIQAGSSVKVAGDHRQDIAFHPSAFMIGFRLLEPVANPGNATISTMIHPETGMPVRMTTWWNPSWA